MIKRQIFSTKFGFQIKETYPNGVESWSDFYTRAELRSLIISFGLCEHTAERMISESRYRLVEKIETSIQSELSKTLVKQ